MRVIDAIVGKLGLRDAFVEVFSAEHEPFGKPHPAVFLTTAAHLGIRPDACLVVEDSINGVIAAKAARMRAVAIPEPFLYEAPQFGIADHKLRSATELTPAIWQQLLA